MADANSVMLKCLAALDEARAVLGLPTVAQQSDSDKNAAFTAGAASRDDEVNGLKAQASQLQARIDQGLGDAKKTVSDLGG